MEATGLLRTSKGMVGPVVEMMVRAADFVQVSTRGQMKLAIDKARHSE